MSMCVNIARVTMVTAKGVSPEKSATATLLDPFKFLEALISPMFTAGRISVMAEHSYY
jgi:hypothetical protein